MYEQFAYRNEIAGSSMTSPMEADGSYDAALAACIRDARQSTRFAHEEGVDDDDFVKTFELAIKNAASAVEKESPHTAPTMPAVPSPRVAAAAPFDA